MGAILPGACVAGPGEGRMANARTWTLFDHSQTLTTGSPKLGMNDEVAAGRILAG